MSNDGGSKIQQEIYKFTLKTTPPYCGLMTWLLENQLLEAAWHRVRETEGANTPGIDGETCNGIASRASAWLNSLHSQLIQGTYVPQKAVHIDIPKNSGNGTRTIGILTVKDRIIQTALKLVLEPVFERFFHENSFGFRPGRSVAAALNTVCMAVASNDRLAFSHSYAVHLDVADCFGTIDHEVLMQCFGNLISDSDLTVLVRKILASNVQYTGFWNKRSIGLVQGGALSPLLCNLYLHGLDEEMANFSRMHHGSIQTFRYADDLLLVGRTKQMVESGIHHVKRFLKSRHQRLGEYRQTDLIGQNCTWLGVQFQPYCNPWTNSVAMKYAIPHEKVDKMLRQIDEMTMPPSERIEADTFDLGKWIASINTRLREWYNTICFSGNAAEIFETLDERMFERVGYLLKCVLKIRKNRLSRLYQKRLSHGFLTWEINGCRLTVLSSLAPKRPINSVRRQPWKPQKTKSKIKSSTSPLITIGRKAK